MAREEDGDVRLDGAVQITGALDVDTTLNVDGVTTHNDSVSINEPTLGDPVLTLTSTATNDDPSEVYSHGRLSTATNSPMQTVLTIPLTASNTYWIEADFIVRTTAGTGVGDGGGAKVIAVYKQVAGTITLISTLQGLSAFSGNLGGGGAAAALTISGANILVQVASASGSTTTWHVFVKVRKVGT